jgi:hypothetical protein
VCTQREAGDKNNHYNNNVVTSLNHSYPKYKRTSLIFTWRDVGRQGLFVCVRKSHSRTDGANWCAFFAGGSFHTVLPRGEKRIQQRTHAGRTRMTLWCHNESQSSSLSHSQTRSRPFDDMCMCDDAHCFACHFRSKESDDAGCVMTWRSCRIQICPIRW